MMKSNESIEKPHGTQLISRAATVLRLLASGRTEGLRLADLERRSGLTQPTVHRILRGLLAEELVIQDDGSRMYTLGPLAYELGLAAKPRYDLRGLARAAVERVAQKTGDTVYLHMRSGYEAVCVDRCEGSFPIKTLTVEVGFRRPLGIGAGSLALLAALPDNDVTEILKTNAPRYRAYKGLDVASLWTQVRHTRTQGFAMNTIAITKGVAAVAVAIFDRENAPIGGIGVASIIPRIEGARSRMLADTLLEASRAIQRLIPRQ